VSPVWVGLAVLLALPVLTILILTIGMVFGSDTPRGTNDDWCKTLDPTPEQEEDGQ
jgi:hypothetical protein